MLDISVDSVSLRVLNGVTLRFPKSSHTGVIGSPGAGVSTLLRVIAGLEKPVSGTVRIGAQEVTSLRYDRRPLLYATSDLDAPDRWSVEHALVNAVRSRSLDRTDRLHELKLAAEKWSLDLGRKIGTLSTTERAHVHLARIELRKPAILIADRLLRDVPGAADGWYRTLRVLGTTAISAPAFVAELGQTDQVAILHQGAVLQAGSAAHLFEKPASVEAARATGDVNEIPAVVRGAEVHTPVGVWPVVAAPFQGEGVVLLRPDAFAIARAGEESDFILSVEEASFEAGRWLVRGLLSGGLTLRVALPSDERLFKGRLLPLRIDVNRAVLLRRSA